MQAEQIAKQLGNAKKANGQWVASCPVPSHGKGNGDKNPSLSIDINEQGVPLFHCHGGCSQEDVFHTIRSMHLLPELEERPDPLANIKPIPKVEFQQEWVYTDEDRQPVFVKQRLKVGESGKTYRLYKIDEHGRKQSTLADARIVPYNLPALLDAKTAGRNIFLVEGEKAADAIKSIGMIATTAHTGAGSWPAAITEYFAGAQVIILPDNDVPGWQYAHKAAEAILPIAKSVKVVDLGLQGQGDDAYEFIEEGGSRDKLVALVKAASIITSVNQVTMPERLNTIINSVQVATPPAEDIAKEFEAEPAPPKEPAKIGKQIAIEHWDSIQDEPVRWMIDKVLPVGGFTALFGPPGSFKSFHALHIAHCIATGTPWMGNEISEKGAVLYLCGEGFGGVGARIKAIKIHYKTEDGAPIYVVRHQLNLRSGVEDFNALMIAIELLVMETGINFKLIIIDTLARAFGGGDENSASDMMEFVVACGRIQQIVQDCGLMILHHSGKDISKGMRGSSSLLGAVDTQIELLRFEEQKKGVIRLTKQKDGSDNTNYGFQMATVVIKEANPELGILFDITSLAVESSDSAIAEHSKMKEKSPPHNKDRGKLQVYELAALKQAIKKNGYQLMIGGIAYTVATNDSWKAEIESLAAALSPSPKSLTDQIYNAKRRIKMKNQGGYTADVAWLNEETMLKMSMDSANNYQNEEF
jgi:hypothetical protein